LSGLHGLTWGNVARHEASERQRVRTTSAMGGYVLALTMERAAGACDVSRFGSRRRGRCRSLTALNDYGLATDTEPNGAVGGKWPDLAISLTRRWESA